MTEQAPMDERRKGARRTAAIMGVVATLVFLAFVLKGVIGDLAGS